MGGGEGEAGAGVRGLRVTNRVWQKCPLMFGNLNHDTGGRDSNSNRTHTA